MSELFEYPPTRSNRAKWALEELGVNYTSRSVDFMQAEQQSAAHKSIHPLGHVPAYRTKSYTMHESVAIVLQVIDEHPGAELAPPLGSASRAAYYQWCVFASAELDPNLFEVMKHTMHLPQDQRIPAHAETAKANFAARATALSNVLEDRRFILGENFSGADIALGYSCNWAAYTGLIEDHPTLVRYYAQLQTRPAFKRVFLN